MTRWLLPGLLLALAGGSIATAGAPASALNPLKQPALGGATKLDAFSAQVGHHRAITDLSFSKTGRVLATATGLDDGTAKVWDVSTGKLLHTLDGEDYVAVSPDGALVVTGEVDGPVKVWDAKAGTLLRTLKANGPVAFSPDGKLLATEADSVASPKLANAVQLFDTSTWKPTAALKGHEGAITTMSFSADSEFLATGGYDGSIKVWDVARGNKLARTFGSTKRTPARLVLSPDAETLGVVYQNAPEAHLWDVSASKIERTLPAHAGRPLFIDIAPDNRTVVTTALDGQTRLWNMKTGALIKALPGGGVARFTPSGKSLAHGVRALDMIAVADQKHIATFKGNEALHFHIAFSSDSHTLTVTDGEKRVDVWDVLGGTLKRSFPVQNERVIDGKTYPRGELVLSQDGTRLALRAFAEPGLRVWDVGTGKVVHTLDTGGLLLRQVAFSPDDTQLVVAGHTAKESDATRLVWWDLKANKKLNTTRLTGDATLGGFMADGAHVGVVSFGSHRAPKLQVKVWDRKTGLMDSVRVKGIPAFGGDIAMAPKTSIIAFGDQEKLKLWDRKTGKLTHTLKAHKESISVARLSDNGALLATAGWDETLKVWDTRAGKLLMHLDDLTYKAQDVAFSHDGRFMAASHKGWIRVIELKTGRWRVFYRTPKGWMVHDDRARYACSADGCGLVGFRAGEARVGVEDARVKRRQGLAKW